MNTKTKLSHLDDENVVRVIVKTNDPTLFELIYDRYSKKIFNTCLSFTKDNKLALDLTHDIFLKVYLRLHSFNFKAKFSTWIYVITYNYCVDHQNYKRRMRRVLNQYKLEQEISYAIDEVPEEELFKIKSDRLKILLEMLKPEEKALLLMKYQDGLTIAELMNTMNLSESAIKMRLKRTKEKLMQLYKEYFPET